MRVFSFSPSEEREGQSEEKKLLLSPSLSSILIRKRGRINRTLRGSGAQDTHKVRGVLSLTWGVGAE
jgi:hypothetical protein